MKKVTNIERILYISIIVIQTAIIIFYFIQLINIKGKMRQINQKRFKISQIKNLDSFSGINELNTEEFIQFFPSSNKDYIFIKISSNCPYCSIFIEKFNKYLIDHEIDKKIEIIYISHSNYSKKYLIDGFKFLIVKSKKTLQQFGYMVPIIYVVNGKGDVLYQSIIPEENTFNHVFNIIKIKKGVKI